MSEQLQRKLRSSILNTGHPTDVLVTPALFWFRGHFKLLKHILQMLETVPLTGRLSLSDFHFHSSGKEDWSILEQFLKIWLFPLWHKIGSYRTALQRPRIKYCFNTCDNVFTGSLSSLGQRTSQQKCQKWGRKIPCQGQFVWPSMKLRGYYLPGSMDSFCKRNFNTNPEFNFHTRPPRDQLSQALLIAKRQKSYWFLPQCRKATYWPLWCDAHFSEK